MHVESDDRGCPASGCDGEAAWLKPKGRAAAFKALDGPTTRREIQRAYVDRLAGMVVGATPGVPDDARALARLQLTRIDQRCSRVLSSEQPMSDTIRAHLAESRARIKRALEAGRDADAPRPALGGSIAAPTN